MTYEMAHASNGYGVKRLMSPFFSIFQDMSNAVVGTISELYPGDVEEDPDPDRVVKLLMHKNRHMYLVLTVIMILMLYVIIVP